MLLWGMLAVSVPIIIHLLSKRRFKIVNWAAMDFLLEADKKNRRRVRLENLILLLLRCLAVILIALLVARPFFEPQGLGALASQGAGFHRIIVIDDSPSMAAATGTRTSFDAARDGLVGFVEQLGEQRPGDTISVVTTSDPGRANPSGRPLSAETVTEVKQLLRNMKMSDRPANLDAALLELENRLAGDPDSENRVVYLVSDLRRKDWLAEKPSAEAASLSTVGDASVASVLRRVAEKVDGFVVVDVGGDETDNISVAEVKALDSTIVGGIDTRFEVTLVNHGPSEVTEIPVTFTAGASVPLTAVVPKIGAGSENRVSVPFTFRFPDAGSTPVTVEIGPEGGDLLTVDNARHFAARVRAGVKILVVDGDPSSEWGMSESFFLKFALNPPGDALAGNIVEVVSENQFEGMDLQPYQLIFLCNVFKLGALGSDDDVVLMLERFVNEGGGLVMFLGDQVDDVFYNKRLFNDGKGLLPMRLDAPPLMDAELKIANFDIVQPNHPVMSFFKGMDAPIIERVKVFNWFTGELSKKQLDSGVTSVIARLGGDGEGAPAIVERQFGQGKVLLFNMPPDNDWSNWPNDQSYLITMMELVNYAAKRLTQSGNAEVASALRYHVDTAKYMLKGKLTKPEAEPTVVDARPVDDSKRIAFEISRDDVMRRGFYELELTRYTGETERILFGVNIEPTESDLGRVDETTLQNRLGDANVEFVDGRATLSQGAQAGRREIWQTILIALLIALALEQFLGWQFGRARS